MSLADLDLRWASGLEEHPPPTDNATLMHGYYVPRFQQVATQGVLEYCKLLLEHRTALQQYTLPVSVIMNLHVLLTDEVE